MKRFKKRKLFGRKYIAREKRKTRMFIFLFVWGLASAWIIGNFALSLEIVRGYSMYPTLEGGDFHLVNKFVYCLKEPERKDLVVIKNVWRDKDQLIKRVIGVPGDVLEIKNGAVYLNAKLLDESYAKGETYPDLGPIDVAGGSYFVLGDNREVSYDSRACGLIKRDDIRGKISPGKLFTLR